MQNLVTLSLTTTIAFLPTIASAQVIYRPAAYQCQPARIQFGIGASGERMSVSHCSIDRVSQQSANFTYYLDRERIFAQANCVAPERHWYTFGDRFNPDGKPVYPGSPAAANMVNYVCSVAGF